MAFKKRVDKMSGALNVDESPWMCTNVKNDEAPAAEAPAATRQASPRRAEALDTTKTDDSEQTQLLTFTQQQIRNRRKQNALLALAVTVLSLMVQHVIISVCDLECYCRKQ